MGRRACYTEHSFYCIKCGQKGIPLMRKRGHQRPNHHRKKLYCVFCKEEVNHVECSTMAEVYDFKERFELGEYKEEALASVEFIAETKEKAKCLKSYI